MRKIIDMQMKIGETAIAGIKFNPKCRNGIPKLLRGLQAIYCNREVRDYPAHPPAYRYQKRSKGHGFMEDIPPGRPSPGLQLGLG